MTGLPRFAPYFLKRFTLLTALVALAGAWPVPALAQVAPAATSPAATSPGANSDLKSAVENYWHYGKIARYDLAAAEGKKILDAKPDPETVLSTFEAVAAERKDNLDQWLLRWQGVDPMKDVTTQIVQLVSEGYRARRSSPAFIKEQLDRLGVNERAYGLATTRLRESGELAVPFMIDILRDPSKKAQQPVVRRALRDLGRYALNPLVAATEMKDWDTLTTVVGVLGDLGYDAAAPYVARLIESKETPGAVKAAAAEAFARLSINQSEPARASDLFYALAEKFYYDKASISADNRYPSANVWYWEQSGLVRKEVPPAIFNEIMAMRACEYALKLGGERSDDALSLWLASNYKREAELPEGAKDATRPENYPPGHYWGVEAGANYLEVALGRAIKDRNSAVAFRAIRSLQEIIGQSNLFAAPAGQPLINAMQFPDRQVRFEAAFGLAAALPQTDFEGSQRVVPLLAEAIGQTGQASVLVVMPTQDAANKLVDTLKSADGYAVAGATSAESAISMANTLPAVDVIVVSDEIGPGNVDQLFNMASDNARLAGAARLVITKSNASLYEPRKVNEPLLSTTTANDAAGLKPAIEEARKKAGSLPMDPTVATQYATRAGELMLKLGINRNQVLSLAPATQTLLAALSDARPEIVKLSGQVLALINDKNAQAGLLAIATEEKVADDVKISLYKSLATNAKFYGNTLDATQVQSLEKTVAGATNLEVRSAAAEARGALNLPADQAKTLVVEQARF